MYRIWFLLLLSLLCSTGANVILKGTLLGLGGDNAPAAGLDLAMALLATPGLWGGLVLYGMGFLLWIRVLAVAEVSRVYPVGASLSFLTILAASSQLFDEHYTIANMLGVVLITGGVVLCGMDPRPDKNAEPS